MWLMDSAWRGHHLTRQSCETGSCIATSRALMLRDWLTHKYMVYSSRASLGVIRQLCITKLHITSKDLQERALSLKAAHLGLNSEKSRAKQLTLHLKKSMVTRTRLRHETCLQVSKPRQARPAPKPLRTPNLWHKHIGPRVLLQRGVAGRPQQINREFKGMLKLCPTWASPSLLCHRLHSKDQRVRASAAPGAGHGAGS